MCYSEQIRPNDGRQQMDMKMTIAQLLSKYHQIQVQNYQSKLIGGAAIPAAQFALDDMAANVKRQQEIYTDAQICEILIMEIEDVRCAIDVRKAA